MSSSASTWYLALDDERIGPRTLEEMRELMTEGVIGHATLVWTQGMAEWAPAESFPVLLQPAEPPAASVEEPPALTHPSTPAAAERAAVPPAAYASSRWLARL